MLENTLKYDKTDCIDAIINACHKDPDPGDMIQTKKFIENFRKFLGVISLEGILFESF